jgi:hypothetical protein
MFLYYGKPMENTLTRTLAANVPQATPAAQVTQLALLQTRFPVPVITIIAAIGICGAAAIVYRKKE